MKYMTGTLKKIIIASTIATASVQGSSPMRLESMKEIAPSYDLFIFDLWGVVHNGVKAFDGAISILRFLRDQGKPVYFLSNAPRRKEAAIAQLHDRGVPRDLYVDVVTSGDECYQCLNAKSEGSLEQEFPRAASFYNAFGTNIYHLGPDKDKSLYDNLEGYIITKDLVDADVILNTGTYTFDDTLEDHIPVLQQAIARKLPMICANPDLVVIYGQSSALCAGRIAKEYEKMGGNVYYHGKPSPDLYVAVMKRANIDDKNRVLMVGDSLRTDIKGANAAGIHSIFIKSGIHRLKDLGGTMEATDDDLEKLYNVYDATPTYIMMEVR